MRSEFCRFWFSLRNMRIWFWTPLIFMYALLPSLQRNIQAAARTIEESRLRFFAEAQTFIPLLASLWLYLFFREYLENEIVEVLYAADRWPKLRFAGYLCGLYHIAVIPLYLWYGRSYPNSGAELLRLSWQILVLTAVFYGLVYLTRSTLLTFGLIFLGCAVLIYVVPDQSGYGLFALEMPAENVPWITYLLYSAIAGFCIGLGLRLESHFFELLMTKRHDL